MRKYVMLSKTATWLLTASLMMLLWIYPLVAHAQGTGLTSTLPAETPVSDFVMMLMKIIFSVLGILATYLTTRAISYFEKKAKIEIPADTEKMIFDWADQAVGLAHEKAHQVLQKTGTSLNGNEKLDIATQFVMDLAKKHKLDSIAEIKLNEYINAKLGIKRLEENGVIAPPLLTETIVVAK